MIDPSFTNSATLGFNGPTELLGGVMGSYLLKIEYGLPQAVGGYLAVIFIFHTDGASINAGSLAATSVVQVFAKWVDDPAFAKEPYEFRS